MLSTLDYENPKNLPQRPMRAWAVAKVLGWVSLGGILVYLGFCLWLVTMFWLEQRVSLTVVNHAAIPANVWILEVNGPIYDADAPVPATIATSPLISMDPVASGRSETTSARTARDIGWSVVRVVVGGTTYEGGGATLLDHHGPHRYTVDVYDDKVVAIYRSNRRTTTFELRRVLPTPPPTTRRSRSRRSGAAATAPAATLPGPRG